MFFKKYVLLKVSQYSQENTCPGRCRPPSFTEAFFYRTPTVAECVFSRQQILFSADCGIYCWQSHWQLSSELLRKQRIKRQKQPLKLLCKKCVFRTFVNFTGKQLCWSPFLIDLQMQNFRSAALLKRDSSADVSLWNLQNF